MEFPDLGRNCHESTCKQLDFLPMKCDACSNIFCRDHIHYNAHGCPESFRKNNQVPVCPLCNQPIPVKKDELPDVVVGQHIDNECQSDPARKRRKIYTNKCSFKGCKTKELIPVNCEKCRQNFCLKHRHEQDHHCEGFQGSGRGMSLAGAAALFRTAGPSKTTTQKKPNNTSKPQSTTMTQIGRDLNRQRQERQVQSQSVMPNRAQNMQAGLSEDEALAQAIQMSLSESQQSSSQNQNHSVPKPSQQEQDDLLLAQAIAASQEEARREQRRRQDQQNRQQNKTSCEVS